MTAAWGESGGTEEGGAALPSGQRQSISSGGWHAIKVTPQGAEALLKTPQVAAAVAAKTQAMTDFANSISITKDAEYVAKVLYVDHPTWPARGFVVAENYKAVVDDAYHSTLMKVMAHFPEGSEQEQEFEPLTPEEKPTAKSSTRRDGKWQDIRGRWRDLKGRFTRAPSDHPRAVDGPPRANPE